MSLDTLSELFSELDFGSGSYAQDREVADSVLQRVSKIFEASRKGDAKRLCLECFRGVLSDDYRRAIPVDVVRKIFAAYREICQAEGTQYCCVCYPLATSAWREMVLRRDYTRVGDDVDFDDQAVLHGTCGDDFMEALGMVPQGEFLLGTRFLGTIMENVIESRRHVLPLNRNKLVVLRTYPDPLHNHIELVHRSKVMPMITSCVTTGGSVTVTTRDCVEGALRSDFVGMQVTTLHNFLVSLNVKGIPVYARRGHNQFFRPTRFEDVFNSHVEFEVLKRINPQYVSSLDNLVAESDKAKNKTGYANFIAEPGTGKTVAFPFRFQESRVAVILPTAFDAWTGFSAADGPANLNTYSQVVSNGARVTYFDSYTAGFALCNDRFHFDVVLIDEADSSAGITAALVELDIPGAFVVHVSGTSADTRVERSSSHPVQEIPTLPSVTDQFSLAVDYVRGNVGPADRAVVMAPDPKTATKLSKCLEGSKVLCADSEVSVLSGVFDNQTTGLLLVTDDVCARGVNLNLDKVFDFQLVGPVEGRRVVTKSEMRQRKGRVGRLKSGVYHYTKSTYSDSNFTELDVFRSNVARAVFGTPLAPCSTLVDLKALPKLMVSDYEPLFRQMELVDSGTAKTAVASVRRPASTSSRRQSSASSVDLAPAWVKFVAGYRPQHGSKQRSSGSGSVVSKGDLLSRDRSSSSEARLDLARPRGVVDTPPTTATTASFPRGSEHRSRPVVGGPRPPALDLSTWDSDTAWPDALGEMYSRGDKLPVIVPPAGWVYTRSTTQGLSYLDRLQGVVRDGPTLAAPEFEVVARAWNVLVARSSFSFRQGQDVWDDDKLMVFCIEYFDTFIISN